MDIKKKLNAHINNIALSHTVFDLPFAFMGALLAAEGHPALWDLFWIAVAVTSGRAAAMALDNFADLEYDRKQPRLSYRAMVKGEITKPEAALFILICLLLMVVAVSQLRPICMKLLPLAALPFIVYPFTKRFTGWCHMFLGLAIAMAPAGGWVAAGGEISFSLIILCTAVALWIGTFDAMYGAQDEAFDRSQGLHSMATEYGQSKTFRIAKRLHGVCILCFLLLGLILGLRWPYFLGVAVGAATLVYQHSIIGPHDFRRVTQAYFMRNGIVSMAICLCTWISYYI